MIPFDELIKDKKLQSQIDWEMTPQEAYQTYQIKSINAWKYGDPPETHLVLIYVYQGDAKVMLIRRNVKDSEEIAEIPVPSDLLWACLHEQGGDNVPVGQYGLNDPVKDWLKAKFRGE